MKTLSDFKHFLFCSIKVGQSFFTTHVIVSLNVQFTCTDNKLKLEDRSHKKKIMFCIAKTKCPEKDIKVSAKVLRNASFLALYCCGNQSQRSLLYVARFSRYKHFCVLQKIRKFKMSAIFGETKYF